MAPNRPAPSPFWRTQFERRHMLDGAAAHYHHLADAMRAEGVRAVTVDALDQLAQLLEADK